MEAFRRCLDLPIVGSYSVIYVKQAAAQALDRLGEPRHVED